MLNDGAIPPRSEVDWFGISADRQPTGGIITGAHAASERYAPNTSASFAKHAHGV
jgi:hypothetical protein